MAAQNGHRHPWRGVRRDSALGTDRDSRSRRTRAGPAGPGPGPPRRRPGRSRQPAGQPRRHSSSHDLGGSHRTGEDLRVTDGAQVRRRHGALPVRSEGILRLRNRQRPAVQDPHRRPPAGRQRQVQRHRPRRVDASERQCLDVPLHPSLLDDVGPRRARHPDQHASAVRRIQPGALQGSAGRRRTGERDPGAGRRADEIDAERQPARRPAVEEDDSGRHVGVRRRAGQLPAGAHGVETAGHETDLRRLPADQQRRDHPPDRRADDSGSDDDRSDGRQRDRASGRRRAGQSVPGVRVRRHGAHRFARRRSLLPQSRADCRSAGSRWPPTCRWR